jgi:hypothetical protein
MTGSAWVSHRGLHEAGVGLASAAGLAGVAAAVLQSAGADPEVAGDVSQLGADGHGLGEVSHVSSRRGAAGIVVCGSWITHGSLRAIGWGGGTKGGIYL